MPPPSCSWPGLARLRSGHRHLEPEPHGGDQGFWDIDLWIGGLAEQPLFDGPLGTTFTFVMADFGQRMQDSDRFYYLYRMPVGQHLGDQIIGEQFADLIMRTTGLEHIGDAFGFQSATFTLDGTNNDNPYDGVGAADTYGVNDYFNAIYETLPDGGSANDGHIVVAGLEGNDYIVAALGDDYVYGDAGNDVIEGARATTTSTAAPATTGSPTTRTTTSSTAATGTTTSRPVRACSTPTTVANGDDEVHGGDGIDEVFGDNGDDMLYGEGDTDLMMGGDGHDYMEGGDSVDEMFGGNGNDWMRGGVGDDNINGGVGQRPLGRRPWPDGQRRRPPQRRQGRHRVHAGRHRRRHGHRQLRRRPDRRSSPICRLPTQTARRATCSTPTRC